MLKKIIIMNHDYFQKRWLNFQKKTVFNFFRQFLIEKSLYILANWNLQYARKKKEYKKIKNGRIFNGIITADYARILWALELERAKFG